MRTTERMYIGEVIDIFKKGSSGHYCSIELATTTSEIEALSLRVYLPLQTIIPNLEEPSDHEEDDDDDLNISKFSCVAIGAKYHLHTYAPIQMLVYHLVPKTLSSVAPTNSESPKGSCKACEFALDGAFSQRHHEVVTASQNQGPGRI
ncbi:hypothetical protein K438DRAFT_1978042 [Mycena galopus ATCC 62051]|nr:hypothetical protein K438DRAFT_1978042 [Mycena galopus ATCC 62051]